MQWTVLIYNGLPQIDSLKEQGMVTLAYNPKVKKVAMRCPYCLSLGQVKHRLVQRSLRNPVSKHELENN